MEDQKARHALISQVENLAREINFTVGNVQAAGEEARQLRRKVEEAETDRASAERSLASATEGW